MIRDLEDLSRIVPTRKKGAGRKGPREEERKTKKNTKKQHAGPL